MSKGKKIAIGAGIGIAVVFVALVALGASTRSGSPAQTFTLTVNGVTIDKTIRNGNTWYIYDLDFHNEATISQTVYPSNLKLVTNTGSVYNSAISLANRQPLQSVEVAPNQHNRGQVAFNIPDAETPTELLYRDLRSTLSASTNVPEEYVSTVLFATASIEPDNKLPIFASASFVNNTSGIIRYTDEVIQVKIKILTYPTFNQTSLVVQSIGVKQPYFHITNISPDVPLTIARGDNAEILLDVIMAKSSYSGNLDFVLHVPPE